MGISKNGARGETVVLALDAVAVGAIIAAALAAVAVGATVAVALAAVAVGATEAAAITLASNTLNQVLALSAAVVGATAVAALALAVVGDLDLERERGLIPPSAEKQGKPGQPTTPKTDQPTRWGVGWSVLGVVGCSGFLCFPAVCRYVVGRWQHVAEAAHGRARRRRHGRWMRCAGRGVSWCWSRCWLECSNRNGYGETEFQKQNFKNKQRENKTSP
jgi:hypothetical protein